MLFWIYVFLPPSSFINLHIPSIRVIDSGKVLLLPIPERWGFSSSTPFQICGYKSSVSWNVLLLYYQKGGRLLHVTTHLDSLILAMALRICVQNNASFPQVFSLKAELYEILLKKKKKKKTMVNKFGQGWNCRTEGCSFFLISLIYPCSSKAEDLLFRLHRFQNTYLNLFDY